MTVPDLIARLKIAKTADEKDEILSEIERLRLEDMRPLNAAIAAVGWPENIRQVDTLRTVWDLVHTSESYTQLFPVLVEHVQRPYESNNRSAIVRALRVTEARGTDIPRVLMEELKKQTDPSEGPNSYRWTLAYTLIHIGDESLVEDTERLLADPRYESIREEIEQMKKSMSRRKVRKSPSSSICQK